MDSYFRDHAQTTPWRALALLAAIALFGASSAHAQDARRPTPRLTPIVEPREVPGSSGSFLAGVVANSARDTTAAAEFLRDALRADPRNPELLDQSFLADLIDGNLAEAFRTAERSVQRDRTNALAHVAVGVRHLKAKEYQRARASFERAGGNARTPDLTISLLRAFTFVGAGDLPGALQITDRFKENDIAGYRDFFAALMAEIARRPQEAEKRYESAYKADTGVLRVVEAYGRFLSRRDKNAEAKAVFERWQQRNPGHPYLARALETLNRGGKLEPFARDAAEAAAEVFYGLGALGSASRDPMTAIIYLQLARYLAPDDEIITMTLAEYFEQLRQNKRVAELYEAIPASSGFAARAAVGRALALERMEKSDEAISVLKTLLAAAPDDLDAADTLGSLLRIKKRWQESVEVYDSAIRAIPRYEYKHWVLYFGRAIGHERLKQWPKAEPDFKAALALLPEKPRSNREKAERAQVLNYLAYSWVDMHMNIEQSFDMLREAVDLAPEDGAIVDSLGWAFYRLGRYTDAVRELERAILLRSGDPTINDHLGDAYWRVGRQREARFKWAQALALKPEPEEIPKIELKLREGLPDPPAAAIAPAKPDGG